MGKWLKSIWQGQSKSRDPATAKFARPDGFDWERLIEEMGKTQEELLYLAASGGGTIFIRDITPQDETNEEISDKVFDDVNGETVLESCVSSTTAVKIHIISSFPMVLLGSILVELTDSTDHGHYEKQVNYTLESEEEVKVTMVLPDGVEGAYYTVDIIIIGGPTLLDLHFHGGYPGSQTEVKAGDTIQIHGTTDVACNAAKINAYGLALEQFTTFTSTNSFIINCTVKATTTNPQALAAKIQARNSSGAFGPTKRTDYDGNVDSYNLMTCNDKVPTFIDNGYTNDDNPGANAFKGTEAGVQDTTVANQDSIIYSSDNGDFAISLTTTYEKAKDIALTNPGDYNDSIINFTIVASRSNNDSSSTFEKTIEVADCAPVLTVTQPDTRLRSALDHTITVTSNQNLDGAPDLGIPVSGTWLGSAFVADGQLKIWTRDIQIVHADARGTGAWTQAVAATNRAGIAASIVGDEIVGGFTQITIVFDHAPAWNLDVLSTLSQVSDVNKLICEDNSGHTLVYQADKTNNFYAFTITDAGGNLNSAGNHIYWCDIYAVGANTQGTAFLKIEETI